MSIVTNNEFVSWQNGQLVTQPQLNLLAFDIYDKIAALTNNTLPCIISGGTVVNNGDGTITVNTGFFRCQDNPPSTPALPTGAQGFFTVSTSAPINIFSSLGDYVVARILVTNDPIEPVTGYFFIMSGSYMVIPAGDYNANTDIILGVIDSVDPHVNFQLRDYDYGNLLSLISQHQFQVITTNYAIQPTDTTLIVTAPNLTLTMPELDTLSAGKEFTIINQANSATTINGGLYPIGPSQLFLLQQYQSVNIIAYSNNGTVGFWQPNAGNTFSPSLYPSISNPNINTFSVTNSSGSGIAVNNNVRAGYIGTPATKLSTSFVSFGDFNSPSGVYPSISNPNINTFNITNGNGNGIVVDSGFRPGYTGGSPAQSTSFVSFGDFSSLLGTNGYQQFPGGLILQWGTQTFSGGVQTVTFSPNRPFTNYFVGFATANDNSLTLPISLQNVGGNNYRMEYVPSNPNPVTANYLLIGN